MITTDVITIKVTDLIVGHNYNTTVRLQNTSEYFAELDRYSVDFIANHTSKNLLFYLKKTAEVKIVLMETITTDLDTGKKVLINTVWLCPTSTPTPTPSNTPTLSFGAVLTGTPTPTQTPTNSATYSPTPSVTQTSNLPTQEPTATPTRTPTQSASPAGITPSPTSTQTLTPTPTPSNTPNFCLTLCSPGDIGARYKVQPINGYASIKNTQSTIDYLQSVENARGLEITEISSLATCKEYIGLFNYPNPNFSYHSYWDGISWKTESASIENWLGTIKICLKTYPAVNATGGNISYANGYKIHTFLTNGNFQILSVENGALFDILVVGGGGGGGRGNKGCGGGGGGGLIYQKNENMAGVGTYDIVVGNGGTVGLPGGFSSISLANSNFELKALGGGVGGDSDGCAGGGGGGVCVARGGSGGSGGGGGQTIQRGGLAGAGTVGQGNNGGTARNGNWIAGGGGGGAGGRGGEGSGASGFTTGGIGGLGLDIDISGTSKQYAGGGGGEAENNGSAGGTHGKGRYGGGNGHGGKGVANTGGGGGGGLFGAGGSGIVIVRYRSNESPVPLV